MFLSLPSPRRTSSQSCSTRSEGCRSSPRLRRNDGILPPSIRHIPLHLSPHLSSSYHSSRYFFKIFFVCFLPLKFMKCCNLFLLLVRPSLVVAWIQPHMSLFSFVVMLLDFLHKNHQPRRGEKDKLKSELIQKRLIGLNPGILLPPLFLLLPLSPPFFFFFLALLPVPIQLYFLPTHPYTIFHLSEEEEETSPLITASRVTEIEKKNERAQMPKRQRKGERGGGLEEGRSQSTRFCLTNLYVAVFEGFKVDPAAHYNSFHTSRFNLRASL